MRNSPSIKGFLAVFVCFASKAVHLEVVTGKTTEAFLAAFKRFTSRRGLPKDIYSDNDGTFRGASKDLKELYQLLMTTEWTDTLRAFFLDSHITWHNIPERAPHFGGLWEAAVKSAKHHLKRIVGEQKLTYEEFSTITAQVEACLNSRPLLHQDSHSPDGIQPPTPGHALIGKPLVVYPETALPPLKTYPDRWTLCQGMVQQFWRRWSREYFSQLQVAHKWKQKRPNLCVGDVVLMKDASEFKTHWGLAKVTNVFPGEDGLVRAVEVVVKKATIPNNIPRKHLKMEQIKITTSTLKRPVAKLALLVPNSSEGSLHRGENVQATDPCLFPTKQPDNQLSSCSSSLFSTLNILWNTLHTEQLGLSALPKLTILFLIFVLCLPIRDSVLRELFEAGEPPSLYVCYIHHVCTPSPHLHFPILHPVNQVSLLIR